MDKIYSLKSKSFSGGSRYLLREALAARTVRVSHLARVHPRVAREVMRRPEALGASDALVMRSLAGVREDVAGERVLLVERRKTLGALVRLFALVHASVPREVLPAGAQVAVCSRVSGRAPAHGAAVLFFWPRM